MVARAYTIAFEGIDARIVEVQCVVAPGLPAFSLVGPPDKAVSEAKERVRAALTAMSIALPLNASPSTSRLPTFQRKAAISTCQLRGRCLPPSTSFRRKTSKRQLLCENSASTAR